MDVIGEIDSVDDAKKLLLQLIARDHQLDGELKQYIQLKDDLEQQMESFDTEIPDYLQILLGKSNQLTSTISSTCSLAETLSSKVKSLDSVRARLKETLCKVDDIIDLKNCIEGVQHSLQIEDFESAANHINRYLSIDKSVLESNAVTMLTEAEKKLREMIIVRYDAATRANDHDAVLRFCRLYVPLNSSKEGVERYCQFLNVEHFRVLDHDILTKYQQYVNGTAKKPQQQQSQQPQQTITSVVALTKIYQHFSNVIEDNLEVIQQEFGIAYCPQFLLILTQQCDYFTSKVFSLFSNDQFPISKIVSEIANISSSSPSTNRLDPRQFAQLLDEIVYMSKTTKLYDRYLQNKEREIKEDIKKELDLINQNKIQDPSLQQQSSNNDINNAGSANNILNESYRQLIQDINLKTTMYSSTTKQKMNELLGNYILVEEYFMVESVNKAIQMDETSDDSLTSSMVDYIFFVLQKSLQRAIDSHHIQTLNVISNRLIRILIQNQDTLQKMFREHIIKVSQSKQVSNNDYKESMISLNNIETSGEYILKLKKEMEVRCDKIFPAKSTNSASGSGGSNEERDQVTLQLNEFASCAKSYQRLLQGEIEQMFKSIQPRLKNVLFLFTDISYEIGQEQYDNNDVNDPFVYQFNIEINQFLAPFQEHLSQTNYDTILHHTVTFLLKKIEASIIGNTKRFTLLGALQFGKDMRAISSLFAKMSQSTVRDKFSKINQILSFLTLDKLSDVKEFWSENSSIASWKLSPTEVKKILLSRVDFNQDQINKLKF